MTDQQPTAVLEWTTDQKEEFASAVESMLAAESVTLENSESPAAAKLRIQMLDALLELAAAKKLFDGLRNNRRSLPEEIFDSAQKFRSAETQANSAVDGYITQLMQEVVI